MSIEQEIAGLTQSTTDLLDAVNTKKATLDTAVSNAQTAVIDATSQVSLAAAEKVGAQDARDEAETHKNLAYTYSQSAASAVAYQDLTAIAESKAVTAVDVFVYDTRKDSDGGAWRKRTQGTSWYNEPLNTSTRGSRKEFPAVAVIVAAATKVTIYDGDDPSLPMWMVFIRGGYSGTANLNALAGEGAVITAVTAHNGILSAASDTTRCGLSMIQFLADRVWTGASLILYNGNISQRNAGKHISSVQYASSALVNNEVNDVAMTVLPDAPIDPDTGLPIPTIAVATDGGVSVIKDDGTVVDSNNVTASSAVAFNASGVWFSASAGTRLFYADYSSLTSDGFAVNKVGDTDGVSGDFISVVRAELIDSKDDFVALACDSATELAVAGLGIHQPNYINQSDGASALITSTYNTGWMNGDIKLATLSDTDDTDLVATELVTNGTFDTDVSGWSADSDGSIISWNNSGAIDVDRNNSGFSSGKFTAQYSVNGLEIGKDYTISADVLALSNYVSLSITNDNYSVIAESQEINTTGAINLTFKATTTSAIIGLGARLSLTATATFDNVSVRLAEPDRSVNGNGLQVFGTVQKNPVATGADLVAYSTLGNVNNYLKGADDLIDYTQDWFVSMWSPTGQFTYSLWDDDNATQVAYDQLVSSLFTVGGGNIFYRSNHYSFDFGSARPKHIAIKHVSGEGLYFYLDGVLHTSTTSTNTTISSARVYIGRRSYDGNPSSGGNCNMSLFRISGTAPTAEQVAKIYRDEKPLFQEGAQATLHGTSDAVTALAYDDSTDLLHVGTSAGRSVFKGLQRVDNTTDAVGTAISASDNFIAEE